MLSVSPRVRSLLTTTVGGVPAVVPIVAGVAIVAILSVYLLASAPAPAVVRPRAAPATGRALPAVDQPPDPCALLNIHAIAFVFGVPLTTEKSTPAMGDGAPRRCVWSTATSPVTTVSLVVVTATSARLSTGVTIDESYAAVSATLPEVVDLPGLGQTARFSLQKRALFVKLAGAWFGLTTTGNAPAAKLKAGLAGLGRSVLTRYQA